MDTFSDLIKSPHWWGSVVLVSFIINIASSYIKVFFDKLLSRVSKKFKSRIVNKKLALDKYMDFLIEKENEVLNLKITVVDNLLRTLLVVVLAIFGSSLVYIIVRMLPFYRDYYELLGPATYLFFTIWIIISYNKLLKTNRLLKAYNKTFKSPNDWYKEILLSNESENKSV